MIHGHVIEGLISDLLISSKTESNFFIYSKLLNHHFFFIQIVNVWNHLPEEIKSSQFVGNIIKICFYAQLFKSKV